MSTKRYFACPYCNKRLTRESLVGHLERNHLEELPEGFSPLRMTFHVVNKKPITYQRPCRICKKPTKWDEKKGRYDFLCGDPNCKAQWVKQMKDVMGDKYGAYRPTASIEGLEKMLNSRKISGKYKWSDGTEKTFTGSYEKEALKFMDLVLEIKSEELMVPGPIQTYMLDGKEHYYIPDMYYIPYNLIIEVKDGGERPNKNQAYKGTRARQRAKEEYIINKTDYNYLRLTDNDFSQLLAIFADLKMHLIDHDTSKTVHVNETTEVLENMFAGIQGMMPTSSTFDNNDVVIVNYLQNNAFTGSDINKYAIAINPKFDTIFFRDKDGKLKLGNRKSIGENYTTYIVKNKADIIPYIESKVNTIVDKDFIYESVFDHIPVTDDQIKFENAIEYLDFYKEMSTIEESVSNYIGEAAYKDLSFANPKTKEEDEDNVEEACKDLATARKFASEVKELASKYDANFYLVTDGASATNNDGTNNAVKFARDSMKKWESNNGFDPEEDWSIHESQDESHLDKDHTTKKGYTFKYIDLDSPEAEKYVKDNGGVKEWRNRAKFAELAICKETNEIAGFIYVRKENGVMGPLKVVKKYRGYGVSNKLFEDGVKKFGGKELGVFKDNEIAKHLYDSHGFKVVEDKGTYYKMALKEDVFYVTEDDTIDLTGDISEYPLLEVTEEDLKKNMSLSPIFVMLSYNGTAVGKIIRGYGKDLGWEYSHSSISLVPSLSTLYSFNIAKTTDEEGKVHKYNGLAIEHFRDYRKNPKCKIKVIAILVDTETKSKIKKAIQYYIDNMKKTKYAKTGIIKALFGTGKNVQNYGNMTMFCSQFVDAVLKQADIDIGGRGSSLNTHPSELGQFKDKNNYFTVYEGPSSGYDEDKITQKIIYMKQTMAYKDLNAITDRTKTVHVDDTKVENRAKEYVERKIEKHKENKAIKKQAKYSKKHPTRMEPIVVESNIEQVENSPSPDHYSALDIEDRFYVKATDGSTNCVLKVAGYENYMRGRSSILIFLMVDNKLCVLLKPNKDGTYSAPGGGWDINEHPMDAAIREAREEVHMNVSNVEEAGVLIEYSDYVQDWVREHVKDQSVWWYGYYSVIFTAEYESMYNGYVASEDQDPDFENNSDFYPISELDYSKMPVEYAEAIKSYAEKKGGN